MRSLSQALSHSPLLMFVLVLTLTYSPPPQVQYDAGFVVEGDMQTPIPNLRLALVDVAAGQVIDTFTTDENGSFTYGDLAPGQYELRVLTDSFLKPFPYFIPSQPFTFAVDGEIPPQMVLALLPLVTSDISQNGHAPFMLPESADGTRAVFYTSRLNSDPEQPAEIFAVTAPGEFAQIGSESADDYDPALSPDAARIAFTSNRDDGDGSSDFDLYVMNYDGTETLNLVDDALDNFDPVWSPDGERLVFITESASGDQHLYLIDADGANLTALTSGTTRDYSPAWSPDGRQIAFASARNGNYDIYVINADGTGLAALTSEPTDEFDPVWSPDGTRIVFSAYRSRSAHNVEVYEVQADGTLVMRDAETITDDSVIFDPYRDLSLFSVWAIDLTTGGALPLDLAVSESYAGRFAPEFMVYGVGHDWNAERFGSAGIELSASTMPKPMFAPKATAYWNGFAYEPLLGEYVVGWLPGVMLVWAPSIPVARYSPSLDPIINDSSDSMIVELEYSFTAVTAIYGNVAYARAVGYGSYRSRSWTHDASAVVDIPGQCEIIPTPYVIDQNTGMGGAVIIDNWISPIFREKLGLWTGLYYPQNRFEGAVLVGPYTSSGAFYKGFWIYMYPLEDIDETQETIPPGEPSGIGLPALCTYGNFYVEAAP